MTRRCAPVRRTPLSARSPPAPMRCRNPSPARISRYVCAWPNCCLTCADLPPLRGLRWAGGASLSPCCAPDYPFGMFRCSGRLIFRFRTDPPSVRRCSTRLIRQAETLELQPRSRPPSSHTVLFSSKRSTSSRFAASGGRGSFAPPCAPLSRPRAAGFFYPNKRWLCAGGRTERQRGWLPAQFLSLEEKRSHSRRGRRRRPLFPHGSCPARGRSHGGTLCTTKPVRTELGFRTHRLYSSGE